MDIKGKRNRSDRNINASYPGLPQAIGSAASESNCEWYARASSWQGNANVDYDAVEAEKRENDLRFGTPYDDVLPNPNGVPDNVGFSGVASRDTDSTLPNPHNFSSNPGYMASSTGSMVTASTPRTGSAGRYRTAGGGSTPGGTAAKMRNPTVGRSPVMRRGSVSTPAPGDTDPRSEGGPQMMTSGYSG